MTPLENELDPAVVARVIRTLAETQKIDAAAVGIASTFEELQIDSLDGINILFALENEFGISIPDEEARAVKSVRELAEGVQKLVGGKG
jgi:acyl carrier protein